MPKYKSGSAQKTNKAREWCHKSFVEKWACLILIYFVLGRHLENTRTALLFAVVSPHLPWDNEHLHLVFPS
jgi:hypothetical protein